MSLGLLDFATLRLGWWPNRYLMAPAGLCANAVAHRQSPTFDVPAARLRHAFLAVARRQQRRRLLAETADALRLVQRSRLFRFPDFLDARFIGLDGAGSTIAVYSRAGCGIRDFGVNRKRVEAWTAELEAELAD